MELIKKIVFALIYYLKIGQLFYFLFPFLKKKYILAVLVFHRVIPREKTKDYTIYYDIGQDNKLYEMTLKEAANYFEYIGLDHFIDIVFGRKKQKKHSILITFDDADADFVDYALPILESNKWPAVVFAPTGYIGTDEYFWHLRVSNIFYNMDDKKWQYLLANASDLPKPIQNIMSYYPTYDKSLYFPLCRDIIVYFDGIKDDDIFPILDQFETLLGDSYTLGISCMNWEQLKSLENQNIAIESHTISHRKLEHLDEENIMAELKDSKSEIESKLSKEVKAVCYPAGSYKKNAVKLAEKSGYDVAFITNSHGICDYPRSGSDLYEIPRITLGGKNKFELNFSISRLVFKK